MFTRVAREEDLREGALHKFEVDRRLVTVVLAGGKVRAFDDACPHQGCSLADDGDLEGNVLTCSCHGSQYDVTSGDVLHGPATDPLTMHTARIERGAVLVEA
jgi:nitrite reductase/ring-hydroxylating ferredoxin subunit